MKYTKLTIKIKSNDKPPYFIGSQLRGAFGYALKKVVKKQLLDDNIYNKFFEQKDVTHKYRFDIRLGLQSYEFSFYLFEDECDEVYNCISAFHEIYLNKKLVYSNGELKQFDKYIKKFKQPKQRKDFILRLETPLRIKKDGKYVINDSLELESIINSIFQRNLALQNKDFEKLPFKPKYKLISKDIFFNDIKRYSNVQNTSMQLGGVMGEMWISDIDEESFNWLKLGEIIGVGKQTVFGLGKISIGVIR